MSAPSLWECLAAAGVPNEYRHAASLACIHFIDAHTRDMQAAARAHREHAPVVVGGSDPKDAA